MQEAFDIFGDVTDLLEMYDARKRTDIDEIEAEQEPDFSDEEAAETFRIEQVWIFPFSVLVHRNQAAWGKAAARPLL